MKAFEPRIFALFLVAALVPGVVGAAPAPWYQWRSVAGETVCAQTSPGALWIRLERVFIDPRCQRPERPTGAPTDKAFK